MRFGDMRQLLDVIYDATTEERLVASLARAASAEIGTSVGVLSYDVDAVAGTVRTRNVASRGLGKQLERAYVETFDGLPAGFVRDSLQVLATTRSANPLVPAAVDGFLKVAKAADLLSVNGWDGAGRGVFLSANLPRKVRLTPAEGHAWTRVVTHLVAAIGLFQREAEPAAIFSNDATLLEVDDALEGDATLDAVRATARAIVKVRRSEPLDARTGLARVPARVAAQWSLVARFVEKGREHILLRHNPAPAPGSERLTERERQVLALLDSGHHMKLIAYELGISYATVRVLVSRARRRLARALAAHKQQ